uniref:Pentacotripeptide-repeat region of PRORP domain-containing protein n=1 Tax=Guillardia theta TaxID=55529 RepID=A0A7S4U756_GUITH|mmetsp:Transcript_46985/g.147216  ORF Transcript_46985/g.147216 Transcript_46985/m.147216 type:complete len:490 (+) Transcript_46985:86-1555(+)
MPLSLLLALAVLAACLPGVENRGQSYLDVALQWSSPARMAGSRSQAAFVPSLVPPGSAMRREAACRVHGRVTVQARRKKSEIPSMPEEQLDNSTASKKSGKKQENPILGEFVAKAYVLLREAGGKLESTKFQKRWLYNYPTDSLERYKNGKKISLRQLMMQCGDIFAVEDVPNSRTKLFCINERSQAPAESKKSKRKKTSQQGPEGEFTWVSTDVNWAESPFVGKNRVDILRESELNKTSADHARAMLNGMRDALLREADGDFYSVIDDFTDESEETIVGPCCELFVGDDAYAANVKKSLELMEQFKSLGLTFGNVITYNALLESCALAARDESHVFAATALSVLDMMRENGVRPNAATYIATIKACAKSGSGLTSGIFKAFSVFQEMQDAGFEPDEDLLNFMLDTCIKETQHSNGLAVEKGLKVLELMREIPIMPDPSRCLAFISSIPEESEWCNWCRGKVVELMEEAGLDYNYIREGMEIARKEKRE